MSPFDRIAAVLDSDLPKVDRWVMLVMVRYDLPAGCYPSVRRIMGETGLSDGAVRGAIRRLKARGLLQPDGHSNLGTRRYIVTLPAPSATPGMGCRWSERPPPKGEPPDPQPTPSIDERPAPDATDRHPVPPPAPGATHRHPVPTKDPAPSATKVGSREIEQEDPPNPRKRGRSRTPAQLIQIAALADWIRDHDLADRTPSQVRKRLDTAHSIYDSQVAMNGHARVPKPPGRRITDIAAALVLLQGDRPQQEAAK